MSKLFTLRPYYPEAAAGFNGQLLDGLIASYDGDEANGTRFDDTGTWDMAENEDTMGTRAGASGTAIDYPFTENEWLTAGEASAMAAQLAAGTGFGFSCWLYIDTMDANGHRIVSIAQDGSNYVFQVGSYNAPGFMPFVDVKDSVSGSQFVQAASTVSTGAWHHFAAWYEDATKVAYFAVDDGTPQASSPLTNGLNKSPTSSYEFRLGHYKGAPTIAQMIDGGLQCAQLWNRPLTAAEITWLASGQRLYSDIQTWTE